MHCIECHKDKNLSLINDICVDCAGRYWRFCRTYLLEFRRNVKLTISNPQRVIQDFVESIPKESDSVLRNNNDEDKPLLLQRQTFKYDVCIRNIKIPQIPEEVLDSLYLMESEAIKSTYRGYDYVFFKHKDTILLGWCKNILSLNSCINCIVIHVLMNLKKENL